MERARIEVFTSPTCPHCPVAKRAVQEAIRERGDTIFKELNTATPEGYKQARKYEIFSVPTIFVRGPATKEILALQGVPSKKKLNELIDMSLGLKSL